MVDSHRRRARLPDLSINVRLAKGCLHFVLTGDPEMGLIGARFGPIQLHKPLESYFSGFLMEVENQIQQNARCPDPAEYRQLENLGLKLFEEVFPEDLQQRLWELRNQIQTLQIVSNEPYIPWEFCRLQSPRGSESEEGGFFCEVFDMSRGFHSAPTPSRLHGGKMAIIAITGGRLKQVQKEIEDLEALISPGCRITHIEPEFPAIDRAMGNESFDIWHVAGHGKLNGDMQEGHSVIPLKDGHLLKPESITGKARAIGKTQPLVFFNNCYSGRSNFSLAKQEGWAFQLIHKGVGAFIGTWWAIDDRRARGFARAFYGALLKGSPLGEAVRHARGEIRKKGDASWLTYTCFGDPHAKLVLQPSLTTRWDQAKNNAGPGWHQNELVLLLILLAVEEPITKEHWKTFAGVTEPEPYGAVLLKWGDLIEIKGDQGSPRYQIVDRSFRALIQKKAQDPREGIDMAGIHERIARVLARELCKKPFVG